MDLSGELLHSLKRHELKRASSGPVFGVDWNERFTSFFDRFLHFGFSFFLWFLDAVALGSHFLPGRVVFPDIKYDRGAGASDIQSCELVGWLSPRGVSANAVAGVLAQNRNG